MFRNGTHMSRTDKTRPFWVKVMDHGIEHHDHSRLGEEVWRSRSIRDENGEFVLEIVPKFSRAQEYLTKRRENRSGAYFIWTPQEFDAEGRRIWQWQKDATGTDRKAHRIFEDASRAVAEGDPWRLIETGTIQRRKEECYLAYTIPDHCTIDERFDQHGEPNSRRGHSPCYMEANWRGADWKQYTCNCSMCRGTDPTYESSRRRNTRDVLRKATKLANSGEDDWDEGFNDLAVTTPLRYNTQWC